MNKIKPKEIACSVFGIVTVIVAIFYIHALAGAGATPISYIKSPAFVAKYAAAKYGEDNQESKAKKSEMQSSH